MGTAFILHRFVQTKSAKARFSIKEFVLNASISAGEKMKESKRIERIRARESYKYFKKYLEKAGQKGIGIQSEEDFLMLIHNIIDERKGFHSETASFFAEESIKQLCKDINDGVVI